MPEIGRPTSIDQQQFMKVEMKKTLKQQLIKRLFKKLVGEVLTF